MIPRRLPDTDLVELFKLKKDCLSIDDVVATFILTVLESHKGNRTRTSEELKMPIRSLRNQLYWIGSLGYEIIPAKTGRTST